MSVSVTDEPEVEVNGNSNTVSRWNAVHHPIKFSMHRQDFTMTASTGSPSDLIDVTVAGLSGDATDEFSVGDFVYLETGSGSGTLEIDSVTNPNTVTVKNPDALSITGAGYINNLGRANYFVLTQVWDRSGTTDVLIGTSINKPDATGRFDVDVSSFLKSRVDYVDEIGYDIGNIKDLTLGGKYNIKVSENWQGFEGTFSAFVGSTKYFTNSSKQIGDLYGSNMGEYVVFSSYDPSDTLAKVMTPIDIPTIFQGLPFSGTFLYDSDAGTITVTREAFDVNGVSLGSSTLPVDALQIEFVNRLVRISTFFPSTFHTIQVWLEDSGNNIITEKKVLKVDHECKDFPLYLTWLNPLGGYDYWLFFKSHKELVTTKLENEYLKNVDDLETSIGQLDITGKSSSPQIDFGARVTEADMQAMTSLYQSPKVLLLTNPDTWATDGPKWQRVIIKPGSFLKFKTRTAYLEVNMTMLLPLINTQKE